MTLKILVTGKNRRIAKDICEHLENDRGYLTIKSRPDKKALFDVVYSELPHAIIICMGDETADDVGSYDIFREASKRGGITVMVVANDEDKQLFMKYTKLQKMFFLSRPVSLFAVYEKLISLEAELEKKNRENLLQIEGFVNPYDPDTNGRRRILVVDDDTETLIQIKDFLSEFYAVTPVKSGEAAFHYLAGHSVDLILLDYLMPVMDGPEVLTLLRKKRELEDIPVIFLTGVTEKKTVIKTLTELKPQGYIVKPAKKSELVAKIIDVLG